MLSWYTDAHACMLSGLTLPCTHSHLAQQASACQCKMVACIHGQLTGKGWAAAVKVLQSGGTQHSLRDAAAFWTEIERLSEIRDKNIIQFYGCVSGVSALHLQGSLPDIVTLCHTRMHTGIQQLSISYRAPLASRVRTVDRVRHAYRVMCSCALSVALGCACRAASGVMNCANLMCTDD